MAAALYHPECGYYSHELRAIGARGDFSTWATLDGSLAVALVRWLRQWSGRRLRIVEAGAGTGQLAGDVLKRFPWWRRPDIEIIETSPVLRAAQRRMLGRRAKFFAHPADLPGHFPRLLYANELVDAFPCRVFRMDRTGWQELHFGIGEGKGRALWLDAPDLPASTRFDFPARPGDTVEIHESFFPWLNHLCARPDLKGFVLIDYGSVEPRQNPPPGGTLRGYLRHQPLRGGELFKSFGRIDLTADVHFPDLARIVEASGAFDVRLVPLRRFLLDHSAVPEDKPGLFTPGGAADCFHVLEAIRRST